MISERHHDVRLCSHGICLRMKQQVNDSNVVALKSKITCMLGSTAHSWDQACGQFHHVTSSGYYVTVVLQVKASKKGRFYRLEQATRRALLLAIYMTESKVTRA